MTAPVRTIETALRAALSDGKTCRDIQAALGWDAPSVSRFQSEQLGVKINKIDALVHAAGYVLVTRRYLDSLTCLGEVGMFCECARSGKGVCGRPQETAPGKTTVHHFDA